MQLSFAGIAGSLHCLRKSDPDVHLTCTCVVCWQMASLAITYQRYVQAARHCCPYTACVHGPGPGLGLALEPDTLNQRMWLHSVRAVFHLCGLAADESAVPGEGEALHWCCSGSSLEDGHWTTLSVDGAACQAWMQCGA